MIKQDKLNLSELNERQLAAVTAPDGPVLVIAGAGSGKTKVLVSRAAYLMAERGLSPHRILAVTFTNKAANEMKERLADLTGLDVQRMWIGTFHSICTRLLRMEGAFGGNFSIYDSADSQSLIKKVLRHLELNDKRFAPSGVLSAISRAKNDLISPEEYAAQASNPWEEEIAKAYREYQIRLRQNIALDFDDLLVEGLRLLERHPELLEKYRRRFCHILVDEYQDTNHCQYRLIRLLAGEVQNLFVVGDPDQSIYGWRGADLRNIMRFQEDYPNCQVVKLVENYRSTQNILDASNHLIAHNEERVEKELFTAQGRGEKLLFYTAESDKDEARFVISHFAALAEEGYRYRDMAVLYRTHAQSRLFEEACIRYAIPYRVYGGIRFYERKEIKDSLAYLRLAANPEDGESLSRIYNEPKRGIGRITWERLIEGATDRGQGIYAALAHSDELEAINPPAQKKLQGLYEMLKGFRDFDLQQSSVAALLEEIWQKSGYLDSLGEHTEGEERRANLEQLYNMAAEFDATYAAEEQDETEELPLTVFLSHLALATDLDEDTREENYLTLMTLHAAKGLEFPIVCLAGMEEGVFPHLRIQASFSDRDMEEERRLCYVGMTRARERLILSAAGRRLVWGSYGYNLPSRFIKEIPPELLDCQGDRPLERPSPRQSSADNRRVNLFQQDPPMMKKKSLPPAAIGLGDRVEHAKFGRGVVVAAEGEGESLTLRIAFPGQGIKQLLWSYAPMKKI